MYSSFPNEYQKSPPPSAPPYNQPPVTGIPVSAPPPNYVHVDHSQTPPYQDQIQPKNTSSVSTGDWSTGLCGCCSDCSNCCVTCLCPCVTFGQVAEIIDKGSTPCAVNAGLYGLLCSFTGCACIYSGFYRTKLRKEYGLPESPCNDFLLHFCCECCSLCQEYRHLKSLGFDLSIGWQGHMEKQNRGLTMSPIVPQGMSR